MVHRIIGLIGVRGSGKDFSAEQLKESTRGSHLVEVMAYADSLREHVFKKLGLSGRISPDKIPYEMFKKLNYEWQGITKTGRQWLEDEGDKFTRQDLFYFVKQIEEKIKSSESEVIILTDVRLGREVYSLKYLGEVLDACVEFRFCNYRSERYDDLETQSNELALSLRDQGCQDGQIVTDKL